MRAPALTVARARGLRRAMSLPEVVLWQALRRRGTEGLRFRRQHPVGPFILDFYCAAARLAVEIDGVSHDFARCAEADGRRTAWLRRHDIRVLRFPAEDILAEARLDGVLAAIAEAARGA